MPKVRTPGKEAEAFGKINNKTATMEITDFLIQQCDRETERFKAPFEKSGYWCATDAHIAVLIKKEYMPLLGYPEKKDIGIRVLLESPRKIIPFAFSVKEFDAQLTPEMIDEMDYSGVKDCPDCYGEGTVECSECGHEHDCPKCDGDGTIGTAVPTGRKIPNGEEPFSFGAVLYKYKYLSQIPRLAEIMGVKDVECHNIDFLTAAIFKIGVAEMFIMPVAGSGHTGIKQISVKKNEVTS